MTTRPAHSNKNVLFIVIVAALGYFVDIYDLVIFSIVRVQSFHDIGIPLDEMRVGGEYVLNMQMVALLSEALYGVLSVINSGASKFFSDLFFCILLRTYPMLM